jgi:cytochrome c
MKSIIVTLAAAGLMVAGSAMAADMPAAGKVCLNCHAVETKMVGPALKDIAKKYKDDKDAVGKISASTIKGKQFGWKSGMDMPPKGGNAAMTDAQVKEVATYIAGLAK